MVVKYSINEQVNALRQEMFSSSWTDLNFDANFFNTMTQQLSIKSSSRTNSCLKQLLIYPEPCQNYSTMYNDLLTSTYLCILQNFSSYSSPCFPQSTRFSMCRSPRYFVASNAQSHFTLTTNDSKKLALFYFQLKFSLSRWYVSLLRL